MQGSVSIFGLLNSHLNGLYKIGRTPTAFLISEVEAGRCYGTDAVTDETTVFGVPVELDNRVPLGQARWRLDDTSEYQFALPVYFTED